MADPLSELQPLFAAERERRLNSLEEAARRVGSVPPGAPRRALLDAMARDAHALKGVAAIETRRTLGDLVSALESRIEQQRNTPSAPGREETLVTAVAAIRRCLAPPAPDAGARRASTSSRPLAPGGRPG